MRPKLFCLKNPMLLIYLRTKTSMETHLKLRNGGGRISFDATIYGSLIGSLRYLLHLTYSVSNLRKYMVNLSRYKVIG